MKDHLPPVPLDDNVSRITAIETARVDSFPHLVLCRIHSDQGIIGCGEGYYMPDAVEAIIHKWAHKRLIGADALAIESHWRFLYERSASIGVRGAEIRALSAIDLALWDILGQVCNQPIYRLLGGPVREKIRVYNSCGNPGYGVGEETQHSWPGMGSIGEKGPLGDSWMLFNEPAALAKELVELGYSAVKTWPFDFSAITQGPSIVPWDTIHKAVKPLELMREAVGWDLEIMIDGHAHFQMPAALRIADALRDIKPFWLEDIIKLDNISTVADFRHQCRMPTSVSEMLLARPDFAEVLEKRAADYIMIDPTWVGGISETKRIGDLAQAYNIPVSMHDCTGPLTLIAGMQVGAALPGACYQETVRAQIQTVYEDIIDYNVDIKDGFLDLPLGPGMGVTLNPDLFTADRKGYRITK